MCPSYKMVGKNIEPSMLNVIYLVNKKKADRPSFLAAFFERFSISPFESDFAKSLSVSSKTSSEIDSGSELKNSTGLLRKKNYLTNQTILNK